MFSIDISFRALVVVLFAFFGLPNLVGCAALSTEKLMDELRGIATSTVERIGPESLGQFQVGGQAINPAIKVVASVSYGVTAGYDGMAGQFQAAGAGKLDRPVPVDQILAIYNDASLTAADQRAKIVQLLSGTGAK